MKWRNLRRKVLDEFYPDEDEVEEAAQIFDSISEFIRDEYNLKTFFAGSSGRGTFMRGDKDIDIFVLFPEDVEREELEEEGLEIGKKVFQEFEGEYEVEYAEHPYTKGEIRDHEVEIVPCYDTDPENIKSAVDRSPHHARWVRENLNDRQKKEVVILKAFLEANELYGSSLKTRGFSGYLCEVLIDEYGSFKELLEDAEKWREEKVIDSENHHEEGLPEELEKKFSDDSLIVIDPVDPERNVASVLTAENYAKFIFEAWKFLEEPGIDFFHNEEADVDRFELKKEIQRRGSIIVLEFDTVDKPEDIVYPQMRKAMRMITKQLEKHDFRIFESGFHVGEEVRVFFELNSNLPCVKYQEGPKIFHGTEHVKQFTDKYEHTFVEGEKLKAKIEREYTDARELLKDFLKDEPAKLKQKGMPRNVADAMEELKFTELLIEDEEWLKFLAKKLRLVQ